MNVSFRKLLLVLVPLIGMTFFSKAQTTVENNLETFQDVALVQDIYSIPNPASLIVAPLHGAVNLVEVSSFNWQLTYTPDAGYIGQDQVRVVVWNSVVQHEIRVYNIDVLPSKVEALDDYATTPTDTPISIDVLANDFSSNGTLLLKNIPLVNNGTADFADDPSSIVFTPNPGFEGIAYLNYTVCDDIETCDNGTVSINVVGNSSAIVDTMTVFTQKNESQALLVPGTFSLVTGPTNGSYNTSGAVPTYVPDLDFIGVDYLVFEDGASQRVVQVKVLNYEDNLFAFNDEYYTSPYESIEINVLENDLYGSSACAFYLVDQPNFGTVLELGVDGFLSYTPNSGFEGVDKFTYTTRPPGCGGDPEIATAYVYVSNYEPDETKYVMVTPKGTPLIIGNNIPIKAFDFNITSQGQLGTALLLEGTVDTTILGQNVTGQDLILYAPNDGVNSGIDEFELVYCVLNDGSCVFEKNVKVEVHILDVGNGIDPQCFVDCVWAGDTNLDGIVNMEDLLPLGLCMGEVGIPRPSADDPSVWYGRYGDDWQDPFANNISVDLKHLDTDGDSLISALDTAAINSFYGNTHALTASTPPYYEFPIVLEGENYTVSLGDLVELDMVMGADGNPAIDVYGFTFPFPYNPMFFVPESVEIDYGQDSWLSYNSPTLYMTRNNQEGLIESGFTRTNGVSASGYGLIGKVRFIVVGDIDGFRIPDEEIEIEIGGGSGKMINSGGNTFGVRIESTTITLKINSEEEAEAQPFTDDLLKVYPNPAQSIMNVHLNGGNEFDTVVVYNVMGQKVIEKSNVFENHAQINVNSLENGTYFLSIHSAKGVLNRTFEVVR